MCGRIVQVSPPALLLEHFDCDETVAAVGEPDWNVTPRREGFKAIETQLEVADALMRGDGAEVQRLLRTTMTQAGVTEEQLQELEEQLRRHLGDLGGPGGPELRDD